MNHRGSFALLTALAFPFLLWAQTGTITGRVTEVSAGDPLPGANVVVEGTTFGAAADADGNFIILNLPAGTYTVTASVIGYTPMSQGVTVLAGETVTMTFTLEPTAIALTALEVLASRATRETPVAYTNVQKTDMEYRLGSRDIPLVLRG
jgi:iron complex outermembrane receptor protein